MESFVYAKAKKTEPGSAETDEWVKDLCDLKTDIILNIGSAPDAAGSVFMRRF